MDMPTPDPKILAKKTALVARLQKVMPRDAVIHEIAETRAYECDALTAYKCPPLCAVLPANTKEVAAVLKICHNMGDDGVSHPAPAQHNQGEGQASHACKDISTVERRETRC